MNNSFKNCLSLSFLLVTNATGFAGTDFENPKPALRLTIRVFNYAQVPSETWDFAKRIAKRIFDRTGVETFWLECSLSVEGTLTPADCELPESRSDHILRLVPASAATRAQFGAGTLGIAAQPEKGTPATASVFYSRVQELAKGGTAPVPVILGHAVAHEIGHLLLGSNSHSPLGLMRAQWSRQDLRNAATDNLLFTREETEAMREVVLKRLQ